MRLVHLFTDYGYDGPYVGELKAVLSRNMENLTCIDLMHDAPRFNPESSAYLLSALSRQFVRGDFCLAIIDPQVGSHDQRPVLIVADEVVYCGPDNGLFSLVTLQARDVTCYEIINISDSVSISFHGRDVYAPALLNYINQNITDFLQIDVKSLLGISMLVDLNKIIYFDSFGNAITGRRGSTVATDSYIAVNGITIKSAKIFSAADKDEPFWYTNSMGLVEIALNQANVKTKFSLKIGQLIDFKI